MPITPENIFRGRISIFSGRSEFDHRAEILLKACDLEWRLSNAVLTLLQRYNTDLDREIATTELITEGPLNSLKKLSDVSLQLGLIGPKTHHDLVKFSKLRNRYAHDRERKQLPEDHEMYRLLQETYLYRESQQALASVDEQGTMYAIYEQLAEYISNGIKV